MATALLAYDAKVGTNQRHALTIEQLLGDGSNGAADHALGAGEMIAAVELPPPLAGERAAYKRAIGRAARRMAAGRSRRARRRHRRRIPACAHRGRRRRARAASPLRGRSRSARGAVSPATIAAAARAATDGAKPLPMTGYKLELLSGLVQDLLEQCTG